jgi:hypothetical protein
MPETKLYNCSLEMADVYAKEIGMYLVELDTEKGAVAESQKSIVGSQG